VKGLTFEIEKSFLTKELTRRGLIKPKPVVSGRQQLVVLQKPELKKIQKQKPRLIQIISEREKAKQKLRIVERGRQAQIQKIKTEPLQKAKPVLLQRFRLVAIPVLISQQRLVQPQALRQFQVQKQALAQAQPMAEKLQLKTAFAPALITKLSQAQRQRIRTRGIREQIKELVEERPRRLHLETKKILPKIYPGTFRVEIRRRGKFSRLRQVYR